MLKVITWKSNVDIDFDDDAGAALIMIVMVDVINIYDNHHHDYVSGS